MSNVEHTPGPWFVLIDGFRVGHRGPLDVLTVVANCSTTRYANEDQANARLIAAAPALLEALEEIASRRGSGVYDCPDIAQEVLCQLRASS